MPKKKLSKTAQLSKDRDINRELRKAFNNKILEQDRKKEDEKEKIISQVKSKGVENFNSESFIEALKESGVDSGSSIFADMERIVNNNEPIKELFEIKNIRMKTNVTEEQHHIITILFGSYDTLLNRYHIRFRGLERILNEFIELAPSIDGQRAGQFVEAQQAVAQALANANKGSNNIREPNEMKD